MTSAEARLILIACRPGTNDLRQPDSGAALEQARLDPNLQRWWREQQAFQQRAQDCFRQIPVPGRLRDQILARAKIVALPWWRRPVAIRAAALVLLLAVAVFWLRPSPENSLPTFRSRMVGNVERQYAMDITTNDMARIREFLATRGAPADYVLPQNLARLPALGAGILSWQDRRVSMVCLDGGAQGTLFLFVVDGSSVSRPPRQPEYAAVSTLMTVSWSEAGKTYVLAGSGDEDALRKFRSQ